MKKFLILAIGITQVMALDYKYQKSDLTPDNLEQALISQGLVITGELRDKIVAELNKYTYGVNKKIIVARLLSNPALWSQSRAETYMRTNLIKKQFNQDKMEPYRSSNHVLKFEVDGKIYVARIASTENRLVNLLRGHGTKEFFYGYKDGQLDANTLDDAIKTSEATYQTSSNLARMLLAKQALSNLAKIPNASLIKYNDNGDISDTNAIVIEEFTGNITSLINFVEAGNDLTAEQLMIILSGAVKANLWDLGQIAIDNSDKSIVFINLEQPDKTRPSDEYLKSSTDIFEAPYSEQIDLQNNTKTLIGQLYQILKTVGSRQTNVLVAWVKTNETLQKFDNFDKFVSSLN